MLFTDSRGNTVEKPDDEPVLWRVAVYGVVKHDGDVLMVQSSDGRWMFPGGGVEENETLEDALVRECAEETGCKVAVGDSRPLYVREQSFYHTGSQRFYHSLQLFYPAVLADMAPDESLMTERDKRRERKWVDLHEVQDVLVHHTILELIRSMV